MVMYVNTACSYALDVDYSTNDKTNQCDSFLCSVNIWARMFFHDGYLVWLSVKSRIRLLLASKSRGLVCHPDTLQGSCHIAMAGDIWCRLVLPNVMANVMATFLMGGDRLMVWGDVCHGMFKVCRFLDLRVCIPFFWSIRWALEYGSFMIPALSHPFQHD